MSSRSLFRNDHGSKDQPRNVAPTRSLMLAHYRDHLETSTSRNGRPYARQTISGYLRVATNLAKWMDAQGIPGDLTPACDPKVLNQFLRDYLESHDLNGTSFQQRNLRNLFLWIERESDIPSPFRSKQLQTYTAQINKPKVLDLDVIRELLATCKGRRFTDLRDAALIRMLTEGPRIGEVLAMTISDVPTLTDPIIRLAPSKGELRYGPDSGRRILVSDLTVKALQRYVRARAGHVLADRTDALWLGTGSGIPLTYNGARLMLVRRTKQAFGDDVAGHVTAHMFRHTFAHDFRANGGQIDDLTEHMGWTTYAMAQRYGKEMANQRAIEAKRKIGPMYQ